LTAHLQKIFPFLLAALFFTYQFSLISFKAFFYQKRILYSQILQISALLLHQ